MWTYLYTATVALVLARLSQSSGNSIRAFPGDNKVLQWTLNPLPRADAVVTVKHQSTLVLFSAEGSNVISRIGRRVTDTNKINTNTGLIEFTLNNISMNDAGNYLARYIPDGGTSTDDYVGASLTVYVKPPKPKIVVETDPVINSIMILNCSVHSNSKPENHELRMRYTWYRNRNIVTTGARYVFNGSQLLVQKIQKDDTGMNFTCKVFENAYLVSDPSDEYNVIVQYGPDQVKFTPTRTDYSLPELNGTLNEITCNVDCVPPCNYTWLLGDENVATDNVLKTIANIKREMAGKYTCKVANRHGKSESSITVVVQYAPDKPVLSISGPNVTEGSQVRLQCSTDSVPSSRITIYGENMTIFNDETNVLSSNLAIPSVNCLDTGLYYCSAENIIGNSISLGRILNILCKPRTDHRVSHEFKQALGTGENMNISGTLISNPLPNIYWSMRLNGSSDDLKNGTKGFVFRNTKEVLTITSRATRANMRQDNFGEYVMHAQNPYGNSTLVFSVTPRRKPDEPEILAILCKLETEVELKFEPNFDGGDTQFFSIEMKSDSEVDFKTVSESVPDSKQDVMTLRGPQLVPSVAYFFRIVSTNSFGTTNSINQLNCTIEQEPTQVGAIIGGAVVGGLVLAGIVIGIFIFLKRRRTTEKSDATELMNGKPLNADQDDPDDGIKPNILYESAGPRDKPQNGKNDSEQKEKFVSDVYAKVVKPKTKDVNNDVYAEVVKPKAKEKKKDKKAKEKKNKSGQIGTPNNADGDVYENAPKTVTAKEQPSRKTNDDGLVYIDVEIISKNTNQTKGVIHGIENKNEYAEVVFTPGAAPPAPDNEGENATEEQSA